jgi:hypothetical protein
MTFFTAPFSFMLRWSSCQEVAELLTSKTAPPEQKIPGKALKPIFEMASNRNYSFLINFKIFSEPSS